MDDPGAAALPVSACFGELAAACRLVGRSPGFAAVVALTLGLGFGANTALFSVVDAVLLKTLPVPDAGRLVLFQWTSGPGPAVDYLTGEWWQEPASGRVTASSFSYPAFAGFRDGGTSMETAFAWADLRQASLAVDGEAELVSGQLVSGGYYAGLGVPAAAGRTITREDDRAGAEVVAVISHGYWQRRFGGASDVIGKTGTLEGRPFRIVGVSKRSFAGTLPLGSTADVSVPLLAWRAASDPALANPTWYWLSVMGRLRAGATPAQAEAEMAPRLANAAAKRGDAPVLRVVDGSRGLVKRRTDQRQTLAALSAVTGLVLLMSCAAVAGLLLARGDARRREIGVRLSLGAGRGRLVRQLLLETGVLVALGGAVGVGLALAAKDILASGLLPGGAPEVALDGRALAFLGLASVLTATVAGLVPALRATRVDLAHDLREGDRGGTRLGLGRALVVAQLAVSLVLLVGAGLFLRTLRNLTGTAPSTAESVHLFKVHAAVSGADSLALSRRLLERFRAVPGVEAAGVSAHHLLGDGTDRTRVTVEGRPPAPEAEYAHVNRVGGDFFEVLGIPLRAGRGLGPQDEAGTPPVVVVNEAFARAFFPGRRPLGHRVNGAEVVGVAADVRYGALRTEAPPALFVPAFQQTQGSFSFQARAAVPPGRLEPLLRQALRESAPAAALFDLTTPRRQVEREASQERMLAALTSAFAALTLLLACLGLYGLMTYAMGRRTREMGVRVALGALPADVRRLALGGGARLVLLGTALGLAGALSLTRLAEGLLFGVTPTDPVTLAAATLVLGAVTLVACWLPARRAARVDPVIALRYE